MNPIVQNILAVVAGWFLGSIANLGLVMLGPSIIPLPEGVDPMNVETIKANIHLYESKHFIFMFLAHAIGTLVGGFVVSRIAASHHFKLVLALGAFFMLGGIGMLIMLPEAPTWVSVADIIVCYLPMAWLGWKLAGSKKNTTT